MNTTEEHSPKTSLTNLNNTFEKTIFSKTADSVNQISVNYNPPSIQDEEL